MGYNSPVIITVIKALSTIEYIIIEYDLIFMSLHRKIWGYCFSSVHLSFRLSICLAAKTFTLVIAFE